MFWFDIHIMFHKFSFTLFEIVAQLSVMLQRPYSFWINWTTWYKLACHFLLPVGHIWLPPRLSAISCFHRKLPFAKINSKFVQRLSRESASRGQFRQEVIYHGHQSPQEARDRGRSRLKPSMMVSLGRKRKLAD